MLMDSTNLRGITNGRVIYGRQRSCCVRRWTKLLQAVSVSPRCLSVTTVMQTLNKPCTNCGTNIVTASRKLLIFVASPHGVSVVVPRWSPAGGDPHSVANRTQSFSMCWHIVRIMEREITTDGITDWTKQRLMYTDFMSSDFICSRV